MNLFNDKISLKVFLFVNVISFLFFLQVGWMMWNWLVTPLALGSAIVLYDGSPMMPNINILWDLVDRIG